MELIADRGGFDWDLGHERFMSVWLLFFLGDDLDDLLL